MKKGMLIAIALLASTAWGWPDHNFSSNHCGAGRAALSEKNLSEEAVARIAAKADEARKAIETSNHTVPQPLKFVVDVTANNITRVYATATDLAAPGSDQVLSMAKEFAEAGACAADKLGVTVGLKLLGHALGLNTDNFLSSTIDPLTEPIIDPLEGGNCVVFSGTKAFTFSALNAQDGAQTIVASVIEMAGSNSEMATGALQSVAKALNNSNHHPLVRATSVPFYVVGLGSALVETGVAGFVGVAVDPVVEGSGVLIAGALDSACFVAEAGDYTANFSIVNIPQKLFTGLLGSPSAYLDYGKNYGAGAPRPTGLVPGLGFALYDALVASGKSLGQGLVDGYGLVTGGKHVEFVKDSAKDFTGK
jgi:hypothetical protein